MRTFFPFAVFSCAIATPAQASSSASATVTEIVANPNSAALNFVQNGTRTALPACANGQGLRWALDMSTPAGQATSALILTAFSQGKQIYVQGTGTCSTAQPNIESVFFVALFAQP